MKSLLKTISKGEYQLRVHSFRIDAELLKKIKIFCAGKGITITEFVSKALKMYLDKMLKL